MIEEIKYLPGVFIQVVSSLTGCNIGDVRPLFDSFLSNYLTELITDEDFAQAEAESKIGREAAKRCLSTAKSVIDQTSSISRITSELENYAAKFNAMALSQEKAVKEQKETRKTYAIREREKAYSEHIECLEAMIEPISIICKAPDFKSAAKNQRMLSSLYNKLDTELANAKIEATSVAMDISARLKWFNDYLDYKYLFGDIQYIVYESDTAFKAIVTKRIEAHKKFEAEKLEAERKRIQEQEKRKAQEEQALKLEAERKRIQEEERRKAEAERKEMREEERKKAAAESERIKAAEAELKRKGDIERGIQAQQDGNKILNEALDIMKKLVNEFDKKLASMPNVDADCKNAFKKADNFLRKMK